MTGRGARWTGWLTVVLLLWAGGAHAAKLRVRGGSVVELRAFQRDADFVVRGVVTDDVGATLGRVTVKLSAPGVRLGSPLPCTGSEAMGSARAEGGGWSIVTDERGFFCVRALGAGPPMLSAEFVGNNLFEGTRAKTDSIAESEQRASTSLRFESTPTTIDLERPNVSLSVSLRVDRADAQRLFFGGQTRREGLEIVLRDERGSELARTRTGGDGRARFDVDTSALGPPGDGELRAVFGGDAQLAPSSTTAFVTRTAVAALSVPEEPSVSEPSSGVPIEVRVDTRRGPVDGGIVEASFGGESVGSATVLGGRAELVATFETNATGAVPLQLRYVPASPHHVAGPPIEVMLALRGPSPARQLALVFAGFALSLWIVAKWRRAPKRVAEPTSDAPPPSGRPEILVMERPSGLRGWRGVVRDAHDDTPIVAELSIVVPSFEGSEVVARVRTDEAGSFVLDAAEARGAKLVIESVSHAAYEQPLPHPSVLRVALVSRRRALLDRLVAWARRRGPPFDASKEPTPGHVRRAASRSGAADVATWAARLESAAYGPEPVTPEVERELAAAEPSRGAHQA